MELLEKIIYLFLISVIYSCSEKQLNTAIKKNNFQQKNDIVVNDLCSYVIIEYDSLNSMFANFEINNVYPSKLNFTDIVKLDSILRISITDYNNSKAIELFNLYKKHSTLSEVTLDNFTIDLNDFKTQYVPLMHYKGDKIVFVNCFCKEFNQVRLNWTKEIVRVLDGGNCFFNMKKNLTKGTYFQFSVNSNG